MSKERIKSICVYCGSRLGLSNEYTDNAKILGKKIAYNNSLCQVTHLEKSFL